jgi:hypothetical protein
VPGFEPRLPQIKSCPHPSQGEPTSAAVIIEEAVLARGALRANGGGELAQSASAAANEGDRPEQPLQHQGRWHAHDAPPEPSESAIAPSIGRRA